MTTKSSGRHYSTSDLFLSPLKENPLLEENEDSNSEDEIRRLRNALIFFFIKFSRDQKTYDIILGLSWLFNRVKVSVF